LNSGIKKLLVKLPMLPDSKPKVVPSKSGATSIRGLSKDPVKVRNVPTGITVIIPRDNYRKAIEVAYREWLVEYPGDVYEFAAEIKLQRRMLKHANGVTVNPNNRSGKGHMAYKYAIPPKLYYKIGHLTRRDWLTCTDKPQDNPILKTFLEVCPFCIVGTDKKRMR